MCYGVSPSLTKRHLTGVPPLAVAAGSQVAAALFLAVPAALALAGARAVGARVGRSSALLAFLCTGLAYILYFRLIANAGPANAVAVTYLIPIFAVAWGGIFLGERLTLAAGRRLRRHLPRHRARDRRARGAIGAAGGPGRRHAAPAADSRQAAAARATAARAATTARCVGTLARNVARSAVAERRGALAQERVGSDRGTRPARGEPAAASTSWQVR